MDKKVVKIYYFTGTGNSLKIAKDVGFKLGEHELIFIPELMKEKNKIDELAIEYGYVESDS